MLNRTLASQRSFLSVGVLLVSLLALLPLLALLVVASRSGWADLLALGPSGGDQIHNTLLLLICVGVLGACLGTANGWVTARCHFQGRRWLRIAQLLPLAIPSYLLAATLVDLGSRIGLRVHGLAWAVLVLSLCTYSYVFLLSTECFALHGSRQQDVARSLGVGPWGCFWRVALPMALPSIGAGSALAGMEVVNEFGAVQLLGVPTLSAGILDRWQGEGDIEAAVGMALVTMVIVVGLVWAERSLRRRSRRWSAGQESAPASRWQLDGWRQGLAQLSTLLPPLISLGIPLLWVGISWGQLQLESGQELGALVLHTFALALAATAITVAAALLLAVAKRWLKNPWMGWISFVAGMGYAIPGTVLALAFLLLGGGLGLAPLLLLVWGYGDRFLAVAKGGLDAALERIPPSVDESAASLGSPWVEVLRRIHLPLLRGPLLVAGLLVFVDTVKELPLTFALRPFDYDTLAVRVYQYASDERVGAALVPALLIMLLGLVAALAVVPSLQNSD
jgi:iron(III) transport system permease protein